MNEANATKLEDDNVLPLQRPTKKKAEAQEEDSFQDIMERNKNNEERMKKERARDNKNVLSWYRIKH